MVSEPLRVPDDEIDFTPDLVYTYRGELLTGIAFEEDPDLGLSVISYVDGAQQGWARDYDPEGRLRGETLYRENVRHGPDRTFAEDGSLVAEDIYLYGYLVRSRRADEAGTLTETYVLEPGSQQAELIADYRRDSGPEEFNA